MEYSLKWTMILLFVWSTFNLNKSKVNLKSPKTFSNFILSLSKVG